MIRIIRTMSAGQKCLVIKIILIFLLALGIFLFLAKEVFAQVVINEVEYDSIQPGTDSQYEWVELYNPSDSPIALDGWVINDNSSSDVIPTAAIPARSFLVLVANEESFRTNYPGFSGQLLVISDGKIGNGLRNDGDFLELNGVRQIEWGAGAASAGHSLERMPVGTGSFVEQQNPTPGTGISEAPPPTPGPTNTLTLEPTNSPTPTPTLTPTPVLTSTPTPTITPTKKPTPTLVPTITLTPGPTQGEVLGEEITTSSSLLAKDESPPTGENKNTSHDFNLLLPKILIGAGLLFIGGSLVIFLIPKIQQILHPGNKEL